MNPELLLANFDRLGEAPDAIPRLRQFILELAVRGKLVDHDLKEEPASVLLRRIQQEKDRRTKEGQIRKQRKLPHVKPDGAWFDIPPSWCWVRLGAITQVLMGQSPPGNTYNKSGDGIPLINGPVEFTEGPFGKTVINQYTTARTNVCEEGDLLLCVRGSTTGRTNIAGFRACIGRGVAAIRPFFADQYVRLFIWRVRASIIAMGRGIAFPSVSRQQIEELPIPLPPLGEQHRIVAKVDELMALCDRLESAKEERELQRDRLAAASLRHLNNSDSNGVLVNHTRFYLTHLPRLTTKPEHINQLRQTVLDLAVRGRLVYQDSRDEPAADVVERIHAEKERLAKKGAIPRQKSAISKDAIELAFQLPQNWEPVSLGSICNLVTSGSRGWAEFYSKSGPKFIRAQNIRFGKLRLDDLACVSLPKKTEGTRTQVNKSDLLIVITGAGVTNPALLDRELGEAYVSQHVALIKPTDVNMSRWLLLCLMAPSGGRAELVERAYGAGKPGLNLDNIRSLPIPVPLSPSRTVSSRRLIN